MSKKLLSLALSLSCLTAWGQEYYVYHLIDPRNGEIFYVGKGKDGRAKDHQREATKPKVIYSRKEKRIREVLRAGYEPKIDKVMLFDCEAEALRFEREEIERIGKDKLTNVLRGTKTTKGCRDEPH